MKWDEFTTLLSGLGPDTPLVRVVAIRAEEDKNVLKTFTPGQRRIRNEYRSRRAKQIPQENVQDALERMKQAFIQMAK